MGKPRKTTGKTIGENIGPGNNRKTDGKPIGNIWETNGNPRKRIGKPIGETMGHHEIT